jgi:hypothetical protein
LSLHCHMRRRILCDQCHFRRLFLNTLGHQSSLVHTIDLRHNIYTTPHNST